MIDIRCPKCNRLFHVKEDFRGAVVECGSCGVIFEVPTTGSVGLVAENVPNISVVCPGCRTTHQVPGNARGLDAECMVCKRTFRIPESGVQASPTASELAALRPAAAQKPSRASDFGDTSTIRLNRSNARFGDNTMVPGGAAPAAKAAPSAVPVSRPVPAAFPSPAAAVPAPAPTPVPTSRPVSAPAPAPQPVTAPAARPAPVRRETEQSQRVLGHIPSFHLEPDEEIIDSKEGTASSVGRNRLLFNLPLLVIWGVAFLSWALSFLISARFSWIFPLMFSIIGSLCWMLLAAGPLLGARNRLWLVVTDKRVVMGSGKDTLTINRTG